MTCGYCDRQLERMPEGDYACPPCRRLMDAIVVGPWPRFEDQIRRFTAAARREARAEQGRLFP